MNSVKILAIESSCDETAAAVVEDGRKILSNVISSQIDIHKIYGGVVPEIASRKHIENIDFVVSEALRTAETELNDIDAVSVTYGPGLVGALLVGLSYAKSLSYALKRPLIGVNHIEGHIYANFLTTANLAPPFICLVVSGGHTHLVKVADYKKFDVLGRTYDDAAGEAFDKVARELGLGYPGGPVIDRIAKNGNSAAIAFPRALLEDGNYNFSFSGLKSAVLNYLNKAEMQKIQISVEDVAASFQKAVTDVLVSKAVHACKEEGFNTAALAGGVSCNTSLRQEMKKVCEKENIRLVMPEPVLCTDNAAMIGCRAYYSFMNKSFSNLNLNANPGLALQ